MNYLIYIEHDAENLQFYLWFQDYAERFSKLSAQEQALAPEWVPEAPETEALASQNNAGTKKVSSSAAAIFKGTDFAQPQVKVFECNGNPFHTPPATPSGDRKDVQSQSEYGWSDKASTLKSSNKSMHQTADGAFEAADQKWKPCKILIPV